MNKAVKVILNILIVIASIGFFLSVILLISVIGGKDKEKEDPAETFAGVMDYEIRHRAYGEVMGDYYVRRLSHMEAPAGYEDLYRIGEYGHTAFMIRVYEEKGDAEKADLLREKTQLLRGELGAYGFTADEMDEMIRNAP